jgi:hypothetical protein
MNIESNNKSKDLETLQNDFINAFFSDDKSAAIEHILGDDNLTAEQRLGIYSGSVHGILTQALGLTFPVCKTLVGDKFFDNMTRLFIDKFPPITSVFAEYGDKLPLFLSTFDPIRDIPYFVDMARFEWARHSVYHQQSLQTIDFEKLAEIPEAQQENLSFKLTKTLHLIQSDFRIDDIWFAHQQESDIKLEEIDLEERVKLFIWKDKETIKISLMSHTEEDSAYWDFLNTLSSGATLGNLAESFGEKLPEYLNQSIQSGWIRSFKII